MLASWPIGSPHARAVSPARKIVEGARTHVVDASRPARTGRAQRTNDERPQAGLALFLEDDVLADAGVVLHQLDALARVGLVLARHVRVARAGGGLQLDDRALVALGHRIL